MSTLTIRLPDGREEPGIYLTDAPVDLCTMAGDRFRASDSLELIRGVVVERMVAYYPHRSDLYMAPYHSDSATLQTGASARCSDRGQP